MAEHPLQLNHGVVNNKELELLTIATIQILKRSKKKRGNDEVLNLVKTSLENEISRCLMKHWNTQKHSIKFNTVGNRLCLSSPKDPQEQTIDSRQNIVTSDTDITKNFKFKESFLEDFRDLKTTFLTEINSYKKLLRK